MLRATVLALFLVLPAQAAAAPFGAGDATFGTSGWAVTGGNGSSVAVGDVAAGPGNAVWTAGAVTAATTPRMTVWRRTATGAPDTGFGNGGVAALPPPSSTASVARVIAPRGAGGAYVGGDADDSGSARRMSVWQIDAAGTPVTTFSSDGSATIRTAPTSGSGAARVCTGSSPAICSDNDGTAGSGGVVTQIVEDGAGGLYAIGYAGDPSPSGEILPQRLAIVHLDATGAPVTGFGTGGIAQYYVRENPEVPVVTKSLAVGLVSGKLRVAAAAGAATAPKFALFQFDATSGALDTSFDGDGYTAITPQPATTPTGATFDAVNGIVFAGVRDSAPAQLVLGRMTAAGALDSAFGTAGFATAAPAGLAPSAGIEPVVLADGGIAVGATSAGSPRPLTVLGFTSNGTVAPEFGNGGTLATRRSCGTFDTAGLAVDSAGRLVVAGAGNEPGSGSAFAVARYGNGAPEAPVNCTAPGPPLISTPSVSPAPTPIPARIPAAAPASVKLGRAAVAKDGTATLTVVTSVAGRLTGKATARLRRTTRAKPRTTTVSSGAVTARRAGTVRLKLTPTSAGRRALRATGKVKTKLTLTNRPAAGGKAITLTRSLTLTLTRRR